MTQFFLSVLLCSHKSCIHSLFIELCLFPGVELQNRILLNDPCYSYLNGGGSAFVRFEEGNLRFGSARWRPGCEPIWNSGARAGTGIDMKVAIHQFQFLVG